VKAVRAGIVTLVVFAVLAHGAVEDWALGILTTGAALLLVFWAVAIEREGFELRNNPLLWPLGGLLLLAVLQQMLGHTVYEHATALETLRLATYLVLGFLAVQAFRTPREWKTLIWSLLVLGFAVSVFAIVQEFTWNGKLYWVRPLHDPVRGFGPFVNRNHFAGFLELVLPPGLALLALHGERPGRRPLLWLLVVFPAGALLLSASRGGIVSLLFEIVLLWLAVRLYGGHGGRRTLVALALLIAVVGGWLGVGTALRRFQMVSQNRVTQDLRLMLVRDSWKMFLAHPWLGTGLGTFATAYPKFASRDIGLLVNHAHNDYVELLAEGGLAGGMLGATFLALLAARARRHLRRAATPASRALYVGAAVAMAGLLLHETVDFNLHVPSNAILFLLLSLLLTTLIPEPIINRSHSLRSFS